MSVLVFELLFLSTAAPPPTFSSTNAHASPATTLQFPLIQYLIYDILTIKKYVLSSPHFIYIATEISIIRWKLRWNKTSIKVSIKS